LLGSQVRVSLRTRIFVAYAYCVLCILRPMRQADHSFRGVLPVCVCVCVRERERERDLVMSTVGRTRSDLGLRAAAKEKRLLPFFHSTHEA
jgi:hypothetical protein